MTDKMDLASLNDAGKTWRELPADVFALKTMLAPGEQAILYRLARDFVAPGNAIVDAGAFLGGSTYAFAAGLRDRPGAEKFLGTVFSFDQFLADEGYLHGYLCTHFPDTYAYAGETFERGRSYSFRALYDQQIANVRQYVTTIAGSLLDQSWDRDKAIDVLFIDVSKTLDLNRFTLRHFFPSLIPGRSVLIQQDFHHIFHPYIHVTMEMLSDYFDCIVSGMAASRVYQLRKPIPDSVLEEVAAYAYDRATIERALDAVVEKSPARERPLLRYLVPWTYRWRGEDDEALARATAITNALHAEGIPIPEQAYQAFPRLARTD